VPLWGIRRWPILFLLFASLGGNVKRQAEFSEDTLSASRGQCFLPANEVLVSD